MASDAASQPLQEGNRDPCDDEDLSVEAVVVDYYMSAPLPTQALVKLPSSPCYLHARQVPVMRVFGATPAGQKTCVHIHGLFPYFYFRAEDDPSFDDPEQLLCLLPRIAMELERANELKQQQQQLNRTCGGSNGTISTTNSTTQPPPPPQQARGRRSTAKLVAKLLIVQGMPFYGYHHRPRLFVQIFLYNPRTVSSVVQLLESGCIAERIFQPYEAHIPFLLQVFADYNIEGMNAIHLSNVMFRAPLPSLQDHLDPLANKSVVLKSNVPSARVNGDVHAITQIVKGRFARVPEFSTQWFDRQSTCALEVDVAAECILNPRLFRTLQDSLPQTGELRNVPSLAALWEEERQRRIQNGDSSTPDFSLSVERKETERTQHEAATATDGHSAVSSGLSQSFFRQKMQDAASKVIDKLQTELLDAASSERDTSDAEQSSDGLSRASIDGITQAGSSLSSVDEISNVYSNTIATESSFSFSQVDHDAQDAALDDGNQNQQDRQHEDQSIVELLMAMQRTAEPEWEERVCSQFEANDRGSHRRRDEDDDQDEDEDESVTSEDDGDSRQHDVVTLEIGDILASQSMAVRETTRVDDSEGDAAPSTWWQLGDNQAQLSSVSSVLDVGSPRVDWDKVTTKHTQAISKTLRIPNNSARRQINLEPVASPQEESEALGDMDDLMPPPPPRPPPRAASRVGVPAHPHQDCYGYIDEEGDQDEEDSVSFDPLLVSLTPQPYQNRRTKKHCHPSPTDSDAGHVTSHKKTVASGTSVRMFQPNPPTLAELEASSKELGIEAMEHRPAYYSASSDIPDKPLVFSGKKFEFSPMDLAHTDKFNTQELRQLLHVSQPEEELLLLERRPWIGMEAQLQQAMGLYGSTHVRQSGSGGRVHRIRTPARPPPSVNDVAQWCATTTSQSAQTRPTASQARRTVMKRSRRAEPPLTTSLEAKRLAPSAIDSNVTVLSLEIHANSRGVLLPDPRYDRIEVVCYAIEAQEGPSDQKTKARGVILCESASSTSASNEQSSDDGDGSHDRGFCVDHGGAGGGAGDFTFAVVKDESELLAKLEEVVKTWDPDFLTGFEVQKESIGFLVDRATQLKINLIQTLSRLPSSMVDARNISTMEAPEEEASEESGGGVSIGTTWGVTKASGLWIHGRYILNIWRLARSELKLSRFAREDVVRAVLKREFPVYPSEQLTTWYQTNGALKWKVVRFTLLKATLNLQLLSRMQLITRTSEMARLFGMDFYSVLSRGSQYRVEAVMLRVTKRRNYLLVSPNRTQVARQAPMECIPLVMEPHSSYYADPVVVLDFQSLYPSLVIGYNLCYSTMYGRLRDGLHGELEKSLGVVDFTASAEGLVEDREQLIISPNGVLLSSKHHRLGVLPVILQEILSTRIMVKNAMKTAKERNQDRLEKVLHARQLALKMLANVTYGYTAAGFSGRMPCAQLADAIVQTGRCTLEAAVRLVESHAQWNAKVVYGDTDSLFVLLRGRSKSDAFGIGQEIANAVTASHPNPVTLKLEKVYMGCILVSKKRYVGLKYESPDQQQGVVEAKGVEIVRRDSCGVVQHAMQRCLEQLFATSDLSLVKQTLESYWIRMLEDQLPLKDFLFAKEVRLGTYARGSAPPGALVSAKAMAKDPRAEPRYAERVPYLVVNGPPGARLMDLVVSPAEFLDRPRGANHSLNYQYYIHKQILPSLERLFLLMGANVRTWFSQLPRTTGKARAAAAVAMGTNSTMAGSKETRSIDSFYLSRHCRLCGAVGTNVLCDDCGLHPQRSEFVRQVVAAQREREMEALRSVCTSCDGREATGACANVVCAVWNRIRRAQANDEQLGFSVDW